MSEDTRTVDRWVVAGTTGALLATLAVGAYLGALPWQRVPPAAEALSTATVQASERYAVPVSVAQPKVGSADALVTIVEWCDFHSPKCKAADATLQALVDEQPTQVRRVFRHFADKQSMPSLEEHEFAHMAFDQAGKFQEARALLAQTAAVAVREDLERYAGALGMGWDLVRSKLDKHAYAPTIVADRTFAQMFGVTKVPAIFVNGRRLSGEVTPAALRRLVQEELVHTRNLIRSGTAKEQVYAALTEGGLWQKVDLHKN